jgi:hypothetical protein
MAAAYQTCIVPRYTKDTREKGMTFIRLAWDKYVADHERDKKFHYHLRMPYPSFMKLVGILRPQLEVDKKDGRTSRWGDRAGTMFVLFASVHGSRKVQ